MTSTATGAERSVETGRSGPGVVGHVLALGAILAALVALGLPGVPYFVDEGGLWFQVDARLDGSWGIPYEFDDLDPDWRFRSLARALRTDDGMAQYLRHPLHVIVATPIAAVGSHRGLLALSILGVLAAAGLAAALARRISPGSEVPVFWIIGLASPLAFHAHLWIAHPLAAAAAGAAILGAVRTLRDERAGLVALAVGAAAAAAFRSEGLLVGPALAGSVGVVWMLRRLPWSKAWRIALAASLPPAMVLLAERAFVDRVAGTIVPTVALSSRSSGFLDSLNAAFITVMSSSYVEYVAGWLLVASPLVVYVAAKRSRRMSSGGPLALALALVAGLFTWRLIAGDVFPVPGLLVAFPLGVASVAALERSDTARDDVLMPLLAGSFIAVGVLATQYRDGGGFEWGWRYFAVGIPFLVPAIALAVGKARTWDLTRPLAASAAVLTALVLAVSLFSVRWFHQLHLDFRAGLSSFVADQNLPDQPVVAAVGNGLALLPGLFTDEYERYRWLSVEGGTVSEVAEFLEMADVEEFVVLRSSNRDQHPGGPWRVVAETPGPPPLEFIHYQR